MNRESLLLFLAMIPVYPLFRAVTRRRLSRRFQHDGRTYRRRPGGGFVGADGVIVTGAMVGVLAAACESQQGGSSDTGSFWSSGGGSDGSSGGGSCGDSGGGDSGGGGGGGSD